MSRHPAFFPQMYDMVNMSISDSFGFELEINFLKPFLFQNIVFKFCPFLLSLLNNKLNCLSLCAESQMRAVVQFHRHTATQINNQKKNSVICFAIFFIF